jgi:hypothetical protein
VEDANDTQSMTATVAWASTISLVVVLGWGGMFALWQQKRSQLILAPAVMPV